MKSLFILLSATILISGCISQNVTEYPVTLNNTIPHDSIQETAGIHNQEITETEDIQLIENSALSRTHENLKRDGIDCSVENTQDTKNSFVIDPKNSNIMYIGVESKGVFKSTDSGISWKKSSNGIIAYPDISNPEELCYPDMARIIIDPTNSQRLLLAPADMSSGYVSWPYGETGGLWESIDAGQSWHQILQDDINAAGTGAIAFDTTNAQTIYFGVNSDPPTFMEAPIKEPLNKLGVLYKTSDAGKTWEEIPTGVLTGTQATAFFIDPKNSNNIILMTQSHDHIYQPDGSYIEAPIDEQFGVLKSSDAGKTWTSFMESLPEDRRLIFDGDVAKNNFNNMIVRTFLFGPNVPSSVQQKSYYTTDGAETFEETDVYIYVGRYNPHDPEGDHIIGYSPWYAEGDLVESTDAGKSWAPLNKPAEVDNVDIRISNFVWDSENANVIYASGTKEYLWKSEDSGKSWTTLLNIDTLP